MRRVYLVGQRLEEEDNSTTADVPEGYSWVGNPTGPYYVALVKSDDPLPEETVLSEDVTAEDVIAHYEAQGNIHDHLPLQLPWSALTQEEADEAIRQLGGNEPIRIQAITSFWRSGGQ